MDINSLTIGEVKEIAGIAGAVSRCGEKSVAGVAKSTSAVRIIVLQRGWIAVGCVSQDGDQVTITKASVIRKWGTTNGLGEIAASGPTKDTVLDKCPDIRAHVLTVVFQMECNLEKWAKYVGG
jgi:hypothetical protein